MNSYPTIHCLQGPVHMNLLESSDSKEEVSVVSVDHNNHNLDQGRISSGCGSVYKLSKDCSIELSSEVIYL